MTAGGGSISNRQIAHFPSGARTELLSGEVITLVVLNLPTAGPLLFEALLQEDIYMSASILQFYGVVLLIGNLLAGIGLAWLDPRIRYD